MKICVIIIIIVFGWHCVEISIIFCAVPLYQNYWRKQKSWTENEPDEFIVNHFHCIHFWFLLVKHTKQNKEVETICPFTFFPKRSKICSNGIFENLNIHNLASTNHLGDPSFSISTVLTLFLNKPYILAVGTAMTWRCWQKSVPTKY
jgi:hypothetical protein